MNGRSQIPQSNLSIVTKYHIILIAEFYSLKLNHPSRRVKSITYIISLRNKANIYVFQSTLLFEQNHYRFTTLFLTMLIKKIQL